MKASMTFGDARADQCKDAQWQNAMDESSKVDLQIKKEPTKNLRFVSVFSP